MSCFPVAPVGREVGLLPGLGRSAAPVRRDARVDRRAGGSPRAALARRRARRRLGHRRTRRPSTRRSARSATGRARGRPRRPTPPVGTASWRQARRFSRPGTTCSTRAGCKTTSPTLLARASQPVARLSQRRRRRSVWPRRSGHGQHRSRRDHVAARDHRSAGPGGVAAHLLAGLARAVLARCHAPARSSGCRLALAGRPREGRDARLRGTPPPVAPTSGPSATTRGG